MNEKPQKIYFDVSIWTIVKILLVLFAVWVMFQVSEILVVLLVVAIISIAIEPFVTRLELQKIPRAVSVIVLYAAILLIVSTLFYFFIPVVSKQIKDLTMNLPYYFDKFSSSGLSDYAPVSKTLDVVSTKLSESTGSILTVFVSIFGGILYAVTVFALTFYVLVDKDNIKKGISIFLPVEKRDRLFSTVRKVSHKLGDWMWGQLSIMAIIGVVDGIGLSLLGVKYALVLGLVSGFLEVIPIIGPIVAALMAVFVAFVSGAPLWVMAAIIVLYVLVSLAENQILIPKIMQKATGLSPVIVIVAILVGDKILGFGGAILAIPVAAGLSVFFEEYYPKANKS